MISAPARTAVRVTSGIAILVLLGWRLGASPFLHAIGRIDARTLAAAVAITLLTTLCCAWRWALVAHGLGAGMPLPVAVSSYYRSQFLNTVLPGGVLGDVHRGVRHGRDARDVGLGLRAVAWERSAGQVVQLVLTLLVLLVLPSPVQAPLRSSLVVVVTAVLLGALAAVMARSRPPVRGESRTGCVARLVRTVRTDLRAGVLSRQAWPGIVVASSLVVAGHTATFVIAARAAGVTTSTARLLPLALLVLSAMAIPANVGGWGPREGAAAWAFAAAGLGAAQGVSTAVVYGVLALAASLPGAAVLLLAWFDRRAGRADPGNDPHRRVTRLEGTPRGHASVHLAELRYVDRRLPRQRHAGPARALQRR